MVEYGFTNGIDYAEVLDKNVQNPKGGRPSTDHQLTIPMAKELCMIQRNERGKQARQYFLKVEEQWNSPEAVMRRAVLIAQRKNDQLKAENKLLAADNERMKPKEIFADAVSASQNSILVGEMAKLLRQNGVEMGQNRFFEWLRQNGYLVNRRGTDRNMPTQKAMEMGLFEIKETSITHSDGHISVTKTPKISGKGQVYFVNKLLSGKAKT
uniref:KilAC domain protein n=1 Tax=Myoviridae sp. ctuev19 TaxID=2827716 RepID=A0A8S5SG31_9CAUD|nr:MAG TPA: KilAC domain protein [Myoviridae sp. ctuev19]